MASNHSLFSVTLLLLIDSSVLWVSLYHLEEQIMKLWMMKTLIILLSVIPGMWMKYVNIWMFGCIYDDDDDCHKIILVFYQDVNQKTQLISHLNMLLNLWEKLSHWTANILQAHNHKSSSGTYREQMNLLNLCYKGIHMEEEWMERSTRRDFTLKWNHQNPSPWWSRDCVCLTLLCTTALWGPQCHRTSLSHTKTKETNLQHTGETGD